MRKLFSIQVPLAAAAMMLTSGLAASEQIGSTVKVVNSVTASLDANQRTLALNDGVNQNELIVTGTDAISEFQFKDDTKVALGPGAQLKLDRFVYDPAKTDGTIAVELVKGAFRFITGVAQKPSYTINTPTATIAVRGTIFDLYVQQDGTTWLLLHEGGVTMCNKRQKCQDLNETAKMMRVTSRGDVGTPICWTGLPGSNSVPFETAFPFVVAPPSIDAKPILIRNDIERSDCAAPAPQRTEPPVRRTNYTPPERPVYKQAPRRVERVAPVRYEQYQPQTRVKPRKTTRVEIPEEVYLEPPKKKWPKAPKYEEYVEPPKRQRPPKVTKYDVPDIEIKIKKKPKYPKGDDYGDYNERPRRKQANNNYDGEVAKKLLGIGLGLAIGGFGKKSNNHGDYPSGRRSPRGEDY